MTTAHPLPAPAADGAQGQGSSSAALKTAVTQALVPAPRVLAADEEPLFSAPVMRLPVELDVTIPVREFRVRRLLALAPGEFIETQWVHGNDLPLAAGDVRLAWSEFEVVEARLAVRITRLL
jgi:flagellar motor switch/type III secretory pathway protein FliN